MIDVAQCPPCCSVADSRAGCPYVFAAAEVSQERENGVAERERKGDMTQGHMESSGGSGVTWHAFLCASCFSLSSSVGCALHHSTVMPWCSLQTSVKEEATINKRNKLIDEKKNLPTKQFFWPIKVFRQISGWQPDIFSYYFSLRLFSYLKTPCS